MKTWTCSNVDDTDKHIGCIEFEAGGDWHNFEVIQTSKRLVFGGVCNTGFLESGYMDIDDCFSIDENLQELVADLETYYTDGEEYTSCIVCNERM